MISIAFIRRLLAAVACASLTASCGDDAPESVASTEPAPVESRAAASPDEGWALHGLTTSEQRYSPLADVDEKNVGRLVQAWSFPTGLGRGHEATPLVVDGTMYFTGSWSVVFAVDPRTGRELWRYDPKVPRDYAQKACCDVVNRGVAFAQGRILFGALDGRLIALDAKTGARIWEVVTVDQKKSYTITGAPRVIGDRVFIGNGGAEFGVRGYVSAYSIADGRLLWRTFTVPGDPSKPFESKALERAASTWKGGEWWKIGGGGTIWDSMAYDPELDLMYVGTGNGSPWTRHLRSPGGGDNLYLSSVLALRPATGELVWHYQTTPGDNWDFTATQHMILADLKIDGQTRKVLMQAPKNGFFYVLDRTNGQLISAEKYVTVSWASGVDKTTGRPTEVAGQDYEDGLAIVQPTAFGGHNWQPMSFHPGTGLVYIPAQEIAGAYRRDPNFKYRDEPGRFNTGIDMNSFSGLTREAVAGHLLAWDPVAQREVWRAQYRLPWNGGTLATAGNLVFQGTADGRFIAYRATDGKQLWEAHVPSGVIAAPITYRIGSEQYVAVVAGFGGAFGLIGGEAASGAKTSESGYMLAFKLGPAAFPPASDIEAMITRTSGTFDGERLYHEWCARCHGASAVGNGMLPDLRAMSPERKASFDTIVRRGALASSGMPSFADLTGTEVRQILEYLESRAAAQ